MSNQAKFATTFSQRGAIGGAIGIIIGILTLVGGVDLPASMVLCFWAMVIIGKNNQWGEIIGGIKRGIIPIIFAIICMAYFVWTRINLGQDFNSTCQSFVGGALLFPFYAWIFGAKAYDKTILSRAFVGGFVFALVFLAFEAINGYAMYAHANQGQDPKEMERNLGRGAFILVALLWPLIANMRNLGIERLPQTVIIIATIFVATRFGIDLNFVILALSCVAAWLALKFPRLIMGMIVSITTAILALAPWIYAVLANFAKANWPGGTMPLSYERRADMWLYTIDRINEKLLLGHGLDSAKTFLEPVELGGYQWAAIQNHPHSSPLNIWLEGGAIGALLFALPMIFAGVPLIFNAAKNRHATSAMAGGISAVAMAWAFSYGAWQQWLWVLLFLVIGYSLQAQKTSIYNEFKA